MLIDVNKIKFKFETSNTTTFNHQTYNQSTYAYMSHVCILYVFKKVQYLEKFLTGFKSCSFTFNTNLKKVVPPSN